MEQAGKRDADQAGKVVSIEAARERPSRRERPRGKHSVGEQFDLEAVGFERQTREAREYFWFNVNTYARELAQTAAAYSDAEAEQPDGAITPYHIEAAEAQRFIQPGQQSRSGLAFTLDILQLVGAALCGALAARPATAGGATFIAFAFALMVTVGVFLLRQSIPDRSFGRQR